MNNSIKYSKQIGNGFILEIEERIKDEQKFLTGRLIPPYEIKPISFLKGRI